MTAASRLGPLLPALAVAVLCFVGTAGSDASPVRPVAVAAGGLLVFGASAAPHASTRPAVALTRAGVAGWAALTVAVVAFQVANFVRSPRDTYPTLSSLMNLAFEAHPARALGFAAWLALGWYLLRR